MMSKITTITCDACGNDLTETNAMPKFRLRLTSEALPHNTNSIYAVMVYPPIRNDMYFCSIACIREYVNRKDGE